MEEVEKLTLTRRSAGLRRPVITHTGAHTLGIGVRRRTRKIKINRNKTRVGGSTAPVFVRRIRRVQCSTRWSDPVSGSRPTRPGCRMRGWYVPLRVFAPKLGPHDQKNNNKRKGGEPVGSFPRAMCSMVSNLRRSPQRSPSSISGAPTRAPTPFKPGIPGIPGRIPVASRHFFSVSGSSGPCVRQTRSPTDTEPDDGE